MSGNSLSRFCCYSKQKNGHLKKMLMSDSMLTAQNTGFPRNSHFLNMLIPSPTPLGKNRCFPSPRNRLLQPPIPLFLALAPLFDHSQIVYGRTGSPTLRESSDPAPSLWFGSINPLENLLVVASDKLILHWARSLFMELGV